MLCACACVYALQAQLVDSFDRYVRRRMYPLPPEEQHGRFVYMSTIMRQVLALERPWHILSVVLSVTERH